VKTSWLQGKDFETRKTGDGVKRDINRSLGVQLGSGYAAEKRFGSPLRRCRERMVKVVAGLFPRSAESLFNYRFVRFGC
jgi:hypothetical protein